MIQRIAGKKNFHCLGKNIAQMEIDGACGAVIVHIRIKVEPRVQESRERIVTGFVYRESLGRKERVVDQALAINRTRVHAAHIRIARDIVEIIKSKNPIGQWLQKTHHLDFR